MDYMRKLFGEFVNDPDEVEARCLLAFSLYVSQDFIAADHGTRSRLDVVQRSGDLSLA